jgi:cytochrome c553
MITSIQKIVEAIRVQSQKSPLIRWGMQFAVLLAILGFGGVLAAVSGVISIKASSGHWAITRWFLEFSKQRSVATHTMGLEPPPLDEPWLVMKGAGHYDMGCRPCHGSPELHHPRIPLRMLPAPPYLPETIHKWKPKELFYMVKHGIKFTGMPAWPSRQRDDEVWAMVAFLRAFPELDAEKYHQLVHGTADENETTESLADLEPGATSTMLIKSCAPCHGANGLGREVAAFPKLAGQHSDYFIASLEAYANGDRHSGIMEPIAAGLSPQQRQQLARHFGSLKSAAPVSQGTVKSIKRGKEIAERGVPQRDIPGCMDCHGPANSSRNPNYPLLAGQHADYLVLQLKLFKRKQRGGTAYAHLMRDIGANLSDEQMHEVADYYASLTPANSETIPSEGKDTSR